MVFREVYKLAKIKLSECKTVYRRKFAAIGIFIILFAGLFLSNEAWYVLHYGATFDMMDAVETVIAIIVVLFGISLVMKKVPYYLIRCPHCNHEMLLEKDEVACDCERCQKRIMIVDGYIQGEIFDSEVDN